LKAIRDFTDVRDMVRGCWLALEKGRSGEVYNIYIWKRIFGSKEGLI
jgi:nucleoside-diphosphate-sugar epimerase